MDKLLEECFKNPVKLELYLRIKFMKRATVKQLLQLNIHIPPATLYRNLNKMVEDGILAVVEENKIRGVWEKVYAVAMDAGEAVAQDRDSQSMSLDKVAVTISEMFKSFASDTSQAEQNQKYLLYDSVYATEEEIRSAVMEIEEIISRLRKHEATVDRDRQAVGFVITPLKK